MNAIRPIVDLWRTHIVLRWWKWALKERQITNPTCPDINRIVLRINELENA